MTPVRFVGIAATVLSVVGYGVGVFVPYPGRAFTVAALMVGITLWAVGGES